MLEPEDERRQDLELRVLALIPEQPADVHARGMVLAGGGEAVLGPDPGRDETEGGFVAELGGPLVCAFGRPPLAATRELLQRRPTCQRILAPALSRAALAEALPAWSWNPVLFHVLPSPQRWARPSSPWETRWLERGERGLLDELPADLRDELLLPLARGGLAAAFADGRAASFAYVFTRTERYADLSVDTLEGQRRRGLAACCAAFLVAEVLAAGLEPVWGCTEANEASRALALRLGFRVADHGGFLTAPDAGEEA